MGAPDLLQGLRRAGIALSVLPSGDLAVQPASKLSQDQRAAIKSHKAAIVQALQHPDEASQKEAFEERAAIIEHDGEMSREHAERMAAEIHGEPLDPDRHCWPQTEAMNTREIDRFTGRVDSFVMCGVNPVKAERLAYSLVTRDREGDDRRMCLECSGLDSKGRCTSARRGRIEGVIGLLEPVTHILHRCEGFEER
ncbi:MAG: hypothetical protein KGI91_01610 [Burkholderiales bacterium]|nr:hypothetical protein [Burkholderiales bacterium]